MRVLVHDYAGHPPQIYLSRALARRGHEVLHLYAEGIETPRGALCTGADDPPTFTSQAVSFGAKFQKHNYFVRQLQEWEYGGALAARARAFAPDVIVCSNTPLASLWRLQSMSRACDLPFLFWVMDVYSVAVASGLRDKLPVVGTVITKFYDWLEGVELRRSDKIVLISEGFVDIVRGWGVEDRKVSVMPLWSALNEIVPQPKRNSWTERHGLADTVNLIYAGTLGVKHNPELLVGLAEAVRDRPDVRVVVISEGTGADFLCKEKERLHLENLLLLPFQPFADLPLVLGGADILLALLEPSAGAFSTPGKVLTHLCSGRPQVAAVPATNRARKVIQESDGGLAVPSGDMAGFVTAVVSLLDDAFRRETLGRNARAYAEREFDIDRLAAEFETYLHEAVANHASRAQP